MATRSAILERQFVGEGYYDLCLRVGELIQLQEHLGYGPNAIAMRMLNGEWMVQDLKQTIRLGLIGGGMATNQAFDLTERVVREGYLMDFVSIASNLLFAALSGVEDEPIEGEPIAPTTEMTTPGN